MPKSYFTQIKNFKKEFNCMTKHIHAKIVKSKTPFANAIIAAYIIGIGDILCVLGDLYWLFGDMRIATHPHHFIVGVVLSVAFILITASFIWLYVSMHLFCKRQEIKTKQQFEDFMVCRFKICKEESVDTKEIDILNANLQIAVIKNLETKIGV